MVYKSRSSPRSLISLTTGYNATRPIFGRLRCKSVTRKCPGFDSKNGASIDINRYLVYYLFRRLLLSFREFKSKDAHTCRSESTEGSVVWSKA